MDRRMELTNLEKEDMASTTQAALKLRNSKEVMV